MLYSLKKKNLFVHKFILQDKCLDILLLLESVTI